MLLKKYTIVYVYNSSQRIKYNVINYYLLGTFIYRCNGCTIEIIYKIDNNFN